MSGPIVRKYGFPNFEQIFGKRELEHGLDEPNQDSPEEKPAAAEETRKPTSKPKASKKSKK